MRVCVCECSCVHMHARVYLQVCVYVRVRAYMREYDTGLRVTVREYLPNKYLRHYGH